VNSEHIVRMRMSICQARVRISSSEQSAQRSVCLSVCTLSSCTSPLPEPPISPQCIHHELTFHCHFFTYSSAAPDPWNSFPPTEHRRRPPLWSSGQSSWLQIQGSRVRFPGTTKKVVGLERGPLSLVSTTEELPDRKVAAPV
jgi:hypothetical protein